MPDMAILHFKDVGYHVELNLLENCQGSFMQVHVTLNEVLGICRVQCVHVDLLVNFLTMIRAEVVQATRSHSGNALFVD